MEFKNIDYSALFKKFENKDGDFNDHLMKVILDIINNHNAIVEKLKMQTAVIDKNSEVLAEAINKPTVKEKEKPQIVFSNPNQYVKFFNKDFSENKQIWQEKFEIKEEENLMAWNKIKEKFGVDPLKKFIIERANNN